LASAKTEHTDDYMKVLQQENQKLLQEKDQLQRQLLQYQQSHGNRDNELASLRASLSERERELQSVRLQTNSYNTPVVTREGVSKSAFYALLILTLGLGALAAYGLLYNKKPTQQLAAQTPTDTVVKNETPVPKRQIIGQYKVAADKAYFHNEPDEATRRNAYLVPTEEVTIDAWDERNNFIYTEFTNSRGQRSKGWLRKQDLITLEDWRRNGGGKVSAEEAGRQLANAKDLLNNNNLEGALAIYRPLSQQGVPEAMYQYGDLALKNKNTEIDCPTAMTLLKNASDKNYTPAKRTLGFLYLFAENKSVLQLNNYDRCTYDKDIYKGSKLLMEAVIQGDSTAKRILEELNLSKQNGDNPEGQGP
jgi:eukaryotic-like serine/threonine-protein kinase